MVKMKEQTINYRKGEEYIASLSYFTYLLTYKNINYILLDVFATYISSLKLRTHDGWTANGSPMTASLIHLFFKVNTGYGFIH